MQQAAVDLQTVSRNIGDGRPDAAERNLELAQDHASSARSRTRGPIIWLGRRLPFVGDDVSAVRAASEVMEGLADDSLPKLVDASRSLSPEALQPRRGRIRLDAIKDVEPLVTEVAASVHAAAERMAGFDVEELVGKLQSPMLNLQRQLRNADALARRGATAVQLMPAMLGDEGPRTYALITQNNAEIRSLGGITGAVAIVRTDKGSIKLVRQDNELDFGTYSTPVVGLTDEERELYGDILAMYPQNAPMTPDFPRSAEILQAMWRKAHGVELDGVISIDPVAMSYLLRGLEPLALPDGTALQSDKLVFGLENLVYLVQPDFALQDVYFALVGKTIFQAAVSGQGDSKTLLDALNQAADERRILLWSSHEDEQRLLAGTALSGDMPTEATATPQLGVFLNDAASDKMSFYLDYSVDVTPRSCGSDGSQVLDVTLTMKSEAPADISSYASRLVFQGGYAGAPKLGTIRTAVHLYAPFGGRVQEATLDGEEAAASTVTHLGRPVTSLGLDLAPQQTRTISYVVRTGPDQPGDVQLRTTPGARGTGQGDVKPSACSRLLAGDEAASAS